MGCGVILSGVDTISFIQFLYFHQTSCNPLPTPPPSLPVLKHTEEEGNKKAGQLATARTLYNPSAGNLESVFLNTVHV
jgi:hypothetical protein